MCGIAGTWAPNSDASTMRDITQRMTASLYQRGPDGEGIWQDTEAGIAFGHRRLAIVDLSEAGHQPMISANGRFVITYNGEIYNFPQLRSELEASGIRFRGHSDSEVLLEAIALWGIESTLPRLDGIFAFGLWDTQTSQLHLARDHVGVKPLYWSQVGAAVLFASEMKAFHHHPEFDARLNKNAVSSFLRFNYVPQPATIYQNTQKLRPGTFITFYKDGRQTVSAYWNAFDAAVKARETPFNGTETLAVDSLETLLRETVRSQMISDVPLGAFLSGGVDSSAIVAMMQAGQSNKVRTFSIGFNEDEYDEAKHAKAVAAHLGTEHTELYVTANDALNVVPDLAEMFDEPFADSSQIPTYLVSHMTREHVTVSLSGDGGDELFGGYNRYFWARDIWQKIGWAPAGSRRAIAGGIRALSPATWDTIAAVVPTRYRPPQVGDKAHKLAGLIGCNNEDAIYRHLVSHWSNPDQMVPGAQEPDAMFSDHPAMAAFPDFTERMQILDLQTYLPGDILTKVDRSSMYTSLEARVPYLSPRLIDFAWSLPRHLKIRGNTGKWILREVLYRHVPRDLIERPKMGFGVPIAHWLRGPLRPWAEDLLDEKRMRDQRLLDPTLVRKAWEEHQSGRRNWQYHLWGVLMLQAWLARWPHTIG